MSLNKYPKELIWTAQYIVSVVGRKKLISEERVSVMRDGEEVTFGSMDAYCKGHLFDLDRYVTTSSRWQRMRWALCRSTATRNWNVIWSTPDLSMSISSL